MMRLLRFLCCGFLLFTASMVTGSEQPSLRTPVALTLSDDESALYVANRDSGSVSVVDTATRKVATEIDVGGRLTDIANLGETLIVLDEHRHQVITLRKSQSRINVSGRINVATYPSRVAVHHGSERFYVTSLWSRTLSAFSIAGENGSTPKLLQTVELPFEPREVGISPDGKHIFVCSAFEAALAVVSGDTLELVSKHTIPGHNIGGLAISRDGRDLLISQQELNPLARTTRDDIHWGNLMSNLLVSHPLEELCSPNGDSKLHRSVTQLGEPNAAAGDPGAIVAERDGSVSVLFSGVDEVACNAESAETVRVATGNRPVDIVASHNGTRFVANMFDDSISVLESTVDNPLDISESRILLGARPNPDAARKGEVAFFNAKLSRNGWMSCHSCHTDGHSNGQLVDNLSDGGFDSVKRVLSLHGVGDTAPWAWNGSVKSLDQQVTNSIEKTMQGTTPDVELVGNLVEFMKTIPTPDIMKNVASRANALHADRVKRGKSLFQSLRCTKCHTPPLYTSPDVYDVGMSDEHKNQSFNPPSLIGVGLRRSLFHDGRAHSLNDALAKHQHQLSKTIDENDLADLIRFLESLAPGSGS